MLQEACDLSGQGVYINWLLNVAIAARCQGALSISAHDVGGDGYDRDGIESRIRFQNRGEGQPVDSRHTDVDQDQIRSHLLSDFHTFPGTLRLKNVIPLSFQNSQDEDPVIKIVFYIKDARR